MNERIVRQDVSLPIFVIADALGVHRNTVDNWLKRGVLEGRTLKDVLKLYRRMI